MNATAKKKPSPARTHELNRLSLLLTLTAVLFFTGAVWALGRKGSLNFNDGLVLIGMFLFWQCFHVFDVLKHNVRQGKSGWRWDAPGGSGAARTERLLHLFEHRLARGLDFRTSRPASSARNTWAG
ncbi:MAG: hypothetical protein WDN00_05715 [Limisphaerales bacterium]